MAECIARETEDIEIVSDQIVDVVDLAIRKPGM